MPAGNHGKFRTVSKSGALFIQNIRNFENQTKSCCSVVDLTQDLLGHPVVKSNSSKTRIEAV